MQVFANHGRHTVSVIIKFPFHNSFTIVNDRGMVHLRSACTIVAHADIIFRIHFRPKHEKA